MIGDSTGPTDSSRSVTDTKNANVINQSYHSYLLILIQRMTHRTVEHFQLSSVKLRTVPKAISEHRSEIASSLYSTNAVEHPPYFSLVFFRDLDIDRTRILLKVLESFGAWYRDEVCESSATTHHE